MPDIAVDCFVRHNAGRDIVRNQHEWAAVHIKKIVKNEALRGKFDFPIGGRMVTINSSNTRTFQQEMSRLIGEKIANDYGGGIEIVPVPNGDGIVGGGTFRTLNISKLAAAKTGGRLSSSDLLRWAAPVGKTHLNERARDIDQHLRNLRINGRTDRPVVLFDDVVTTGSQLCAARIKLEEGGVKVLGCCAIIEVIDQVQGARGDAPGWRTVTRRPQRIADLFADHLFG